MATGNYFLDTYGDVTPGENIAPVPNDMSEATQEVPLTGNYFLDTYGDVEAPPPAPVVYDDDPTWGDYGRMIAAGGIQLGGGIGWLATKFGIDSGATLQEAAYKKAESVMEGLSDSAKNALAVEFTSRDNGELWTDRKWRKAKLTAAQSLLGTAAGMGLGSVLTRGLMTAGMSVRAGGAVGYGLGEAGIAAPAAAANVDSQIMGMTHEQLSEQSAEYRAVYASLENADPAVRSERAKKLMADAAAGDAFALTAVSTFVLSAPAGAVVGGYTGKLPLATTRTRSIATSAGAEGIQEFTQSGAETISENVAMRDVDPERPIMQGALESAVGGFLAGTLMGTAPGIFTPLESNAQEQAGDSLAQQIDADLTPEEEQELAKTPRVLDKLDLQAVRIYDAKEKLQTQQYEQMAAKAKFEAEERAQVAAQEALETAQLEEEIRQNERVTAAFIQNELARETTLEQQRLQAEAQKAEQEYEVQTALEEVNAEPVSGTSLGDALKAAQAKEETKAAEKLKTEGTEVVPEALKAPVKPEVPKPTKAPNTDRDSFIVTRAKLPAGKRLSQKAFEAEGLDIETLRQPIYKGRPAFSKHPEAMTPDDVAEYLNEQGYPSPDGKPWDANSALDAVTEEIEGRSQILTGKGMEVAAAEANYAEELAKYEAETTRRAEKGPPKVWDIEVEGTAARITEDPEGGVEVVIDGLPDTITSRKKGESNADLVRAVLEAKGTTPAKEKARTETDPMPEGSIMAEVRKAAKAKPKQEEFTEDTLADDAATQIDTLYKGSTMQQKRSANKALIVLKKSKHPRADELRKAYNKAVAREEAPQQQEYDDTVPYGEKGTPVESLDQFDAALQANAATSPENDITEPSEAQKEAGNYKKAHAKIEGLDVTIENPVGSTRRGVKMKDHYGYVKRSEGADGDQVDVFVNPKREEGDNKVFIIDQTQEDGVTFDEHKVMLGYKNQIDAARGYKRNYDKGWKVGPITEMTMPEFKAWLKSDTTTAIKKPKPSRAARRFVRDKKGKLRYSLNSHKKAILADAKEVVPGADMAFIEHVIGQPTGDSVDTSVMQGLVDRVLATETVNTAQAVKNVVRKMNKLFPTAKIKVVEKVSDIGQNIVEATGDKIDKVRGIYVNNTDEIYLISDNLSSETAAERTALHEIAHKGLRHLLGKDFDAVMTDVYENLSPKQQKALKITAKSYKLDLNKPGDRVTATEELVAKLAESSPKNSAVQKVVAAIRKVLRKIGVVSEWTEGDVIALIAEAQGALKRTQPLNEKTTTEEVQVEETGEIFEVEVGLEVTLRQHDKRMSVIEKLRACL